MFNASKASRETIAPGRWATADLTPFRVAFLLTPLFPLIPYAAAIEPLRAANRLSGRQLYSWTHLSPDGASVRASNDVVIVPDGAVGGGDINMLIVCAGSSCEQFNHPATFAWLRKLARQGVALGGVSGGPYILAKAGVLDTARFTLHWDHIPALKEEFPNLRVTPNLFEIDGDRLTCSGGISSLDLMYAVIAARHGQELAIAVSEWFLHTNVRQGDGPQRMSLRFRYSISNPKLLKVLEAMERRVEEPASREELARLVGVSVRQLERLFHDHLGQTLGAHYLEIRLQRARTLLQQTTMLVLEIAVATGFVSVTHFSRAYRDRFGHPPTGERRKSERRAP